MWNLYWQCTLGRSPVKKTHPETGCQFFLAVLFITYFMDVLGMWKLYIDSAPWENPPRRRRLSKDIFSRFYLLLNLWTWNFILTVHPEQVTDEEDPPWDRVQAGGQTDMCSVKLRTRQEWQGRFFFTNWFFVSEGSLFHRVLRFKGFFVSEGSFWRCSKRNFSVFFFFDGCS